MCSVKRADITPGTREDGLKSPKLPAQGDEAPWVRTPTEDDKPLAAQVPLSVYSRTARRRVLQLVGCGFVVGVAGCTRSNSGDSNKNSKEEVAYQGTPENGQQCSACRYFVPAENENEAGTCRIVSGSIEPDDWCNLYSEQ